MFSDPSQRSSKRFSLLLLEDGDDYVQDWVATAVCRNPKPLPNQSGQTLKPPAWAQPEGVLKGRLRLCSRSFFFEPDNVRIPILMFLLRKVDKIEQGGAVSNTLGQLKGELSEQPAKDSPNSRFRFGEVADDKGGDIMVQMQLLVKMKENGVDAPYMYEKGDSLWAFHLEYAPGSQFLGQAQRLLEISRWDYHKRDAALAAMAREREAAAKFDTSRLSDLSEHILLDLPAAQVTPLVREPGRLVITQSRLYFQPLYNLNNDSPVRSHPLSVLLAVARRRHSLRHVGVEVFFGYEKVEGFGGLGAAGGPDGPSAFFTLQSFEEREATVTLLLRQIAARSSPAVGSILELNPRWQTRVMRAWQTGLITNYDYLIYLNLAAGRSFNDLTQWPVMPWVLADYTSTNLDLLNPKTFRDLAKPIGALNPARLEMVRERCRQMPEGERFLYGTHYSTPGYVLYWLVRAAPAHMLRLQAGRFDAPDRLFLSVPDSWDSVLNNPADVKELIPDFFALPADFLVNRQELNLGVRQNGTPVGDVALPAWADSPEDFIRKHRAALESDFVSSHLHLWIDLIFGHKQRGEAALAADNLFHHLTYEGAVDLDKIQDPTQRAGLEAQINEFGQAPRQLFTVPHPPRETKTGTETRLTGGFGGRLVAESCSRAMSIELLARILEVVAGTEGEEERERNGVSGTGGLVSEGLEDMSEKRIRNGEANRDREERREGGDTGILGIKAELGRAGSQQEPSSKQPGSANGELREGHVERTEAGDVTAGNLHNADVSTSEALKRLESDGARLARLLEEAEDLEEEAGKGLGRGLEEGFGASSGGGYGEFSGTGEREGLGAGSEADLGSEAVLGAVSGLDSGAGLGQRSEAGLREGLETGSTREGMERTDASSKSGFASAFRNPFEASKNRLKQLVAPGKPPETEAPKRGSPGPRALTPLEASKQRLRELIASGRPQESGSSEQKQSTDSKEAQLLSGEDSWVEVTGEPGDVESVAEKTNLAAFPKAVEKSSVRARKVSAVPTRPARLEGELERSQMSAVSETDPPSHAPMEALEEHAENGFEAGLDGPKWVPGHNRNASLSSVASDHRFSDGSDAASVGPSRADSVSETDLFLRTASLRIRTARSSDEELLSESAPRNAEKGVLLRQRLQTPQTLKIHRGPATALVLSDENASDSMTMYSVGRDGFVKVYSIAEEFQVRATRLGTLPLSSVALAESTDAHPTVLAGSFDNCVYAYSVDYGRVLGKLRAHDDTVSCLKLVGRNESRLMTSSWDGSLKVWAMDAGKGGWAGTLGGVISSSSLLPEAEMVEHDAAIWSLEVDRKGDVAFSGAEDGSVIAWDLRKPGPALWHDTGSTHPICSLKLAFDDVHLLIAATDGSLRLVDLRKRGEAAAETRVGEKIRCCEMVGGLVLAGSENGAVHFWPSGLSDASVISDHGGNSELTPLSDHSDAITCLHVADSRNGQEGFLTSASEDGTIQLYKIVARDQQV